MARPVEWLPRGVVGSEAARRQSPVQRFLPEGPLEPLIERFWTISWARLPPPDAKAQLARSIVARILEDRTLTQAEAVAREAGLSLRSLQRLFQEYVGVSPKWVIQRYRLHDAMEHLEANQPADLPALALSLGFFDQAHFNRAFKLFLGRTPTGYARPGKG